MKIDDLIKRLHEWMKAKVTGRVTIILNEGGIRTVKIEHKVD